MIKAHPKLRSSPVLSVAVHAPFISQQSRRPPHLLGDLIPLLQCRLSPDSPRCKMGLINPNRGQALGIRVGIPPGPIEVEHMVITISPGMLIQESRAALTLRPCLGEQLGKALEFSNWVGAKMKQLP